MPKFAQAPTPKEEKTLEINQNSAPKKEEPKNGTSTAVNPSSQTSKTFDKTYSSGEQRPDGGSIAVFQIIFSGQNAEPNEVPAKVGDYVFFKNNTQENFELYVSDPSGKTATSTVVLPNKNFKLELTQSGVWQYFRKADQAFLAKVLVSQ